MIDINKLILFFVLYLRSINCQLDAEDDHDEKNVQEPILINKPIKDVVIPDELTNWNKIMNSGEVRCFCNLPACVSTGYMCKSSPGGGCFSDLHRRNYPNNENNSQYGGRHGCVELLTNKEQRDWCQRYPNENLSRRKSPHLKSLLHCCYEDLCNHADSRQTKDLINDTLETIQVGHKVAENQDNLYTSADVWFKAATIAVPICGAVILFVLIALAVKLLRTESNHHSNYKLGYPHHPTTCDKSGKEYQIVEKNLNEHYQPFRAPIIKDKNMKNSKFSNSNQEHCQQQQHQQQQYSFLAPQILEIQKCYDNQHNFNEDLGCVDKTPIKL